MTKVILEHEYFRGISVDAVGLCSYSVPYVPDEPEPPDEEDELPSALRPYNGDQTIFEEFSQ